MAWRVLFRRRFVWRCVDTRLRSWATVGLTRCIVQTLGEHSGSTRGGGEKCVWSYVGVQVGDRLNAEGGGHLGGTS